MSIGVAVETTLNPNPHNPKLAQQPLWNPYSDRLGEPQTPVVPICGSLGPWH